MDKMTIKHRAVKHDQTKKAFQQSCEDKLRPHA